MRNVRMLTIMFLVLVLIFFWAGVNKASSLGTGFTYQGHFYDNNSSANGSYDFEFKLYDDSNIVTGQQIGSEVNAADVEVIDGYFTVELDFGSSVFNGDSRWLEIGVRPGALSDPSAYITLAQRFNFRLYFVLLLF